MGEGGGSPRKTKLEENTLGVGTEQKQNKTRKIGGSDLKNDDTNSKNNI